MTEYPAICINQCYSHYSVHERIFYIDNVNAIKLIDKS